MELFIFMKNLSVILKKINPLSAFYALFSLAILSRVYCDIKLNRLGIHQGDIFPDRKMLFIPLYSSTGLIIEWLLAVTGVVFIYKKKIRTASLLIIVSYLMGLTQLYQNQKSLILIIACSLLIQPLNKEVRASIWYLRYQLCLVYFISALHKFFNNFLTGKTLLTTLNYLVSIQENGFYKNLLSLMINQKVYKLN